MSARLQSVTDDCDRLAPARTSLARTLHDGVVQRLCAVSVVLGSDAALEPHDRRRCAVELEAAIAELRAVIDNGVDPREPAPPTVAAAVREAHDACGDDGVEVRLRGDVAVAPDVACLIRDFVAEGLRNAAKHARPTLISVVADVTEQPARIEIVNDGVAPEHRRSGTGLGLRLLSSEAMLHRGDVAAGPLGRDRWRAVLRLWLATPVPPRAFERPRMRPRRVP